MFSIAEYFGKVFCGLLDFPCFDSAAFVWLFRDLFWSTKYVLVCMFIIVCESSKIRFICQLSSLWQPNWKLFEVWNARAELHSIMCKITYTNTHIYNKNTQFHCVLGSLKDRFQNQTYTSKPTNRLIMLSEQSTKHETAHTVGS